MLSSSTRNLKPTGLMIFWKSLILPIKRIGPLMLSFILDISHMVFMKIS